MRLGQIGHHFADCTFKCIFLYWKDPVNIFTIINTGSGNGLAPNKWQAITWVTYLEWGIGVFPQFLFVASQMADLPTNLSGLSTSWPELPFSPWSVEDFLSEIYNPRYNPDYLNQWWPSSRAWMNYDPIHCHIYVSLIISVWTQRHKLLWTDTLGRCYAFSGGKYWQFDEDFTADWSLKQGSLCAWVQPMRDDVTM